MTPDEYTEFVKETAVFPDEVGIPYCTLGLCGEAGEVAEKVKRYYREDADLLDGSVLKELGDVQWYLTAVANELGYTLQEVIDSNVEKLTSRRERGVLAGAGDER